MRTYVSILTTDEYLPGVLVLHHSLLETHPIYPFLLIVTNNVSKSILNILDDINISYKRVDYISPPSSTRIPHFAYTYSKLSVFNLCQYKKIIYLDCDIMVLSNIDELFSAPHMSAINAGGLLRKYQHWTQFNSGLLVVEPSKDLYSVIMKVFRDTNSMFQGDQEVLNAVYPEWSESLHLHLDHGYHMLFNFFDRYYYHFGYGLGVDDKPVKTIHFAWVPKPWQMVQAIRNFEKPQFRYSKFYWRAVARHFTQMPLKSVAHFVKVIRNPLPLERASLKLWVECYDRCQKRQACAR